MESPIIILGSPRSGTTILGNLLAQHPELHYEEEPRLTWRYGNDVKSDCLTIKDLDAGIKRLIRNAFEKRVIEAGKTRLLEKTPSNALRPEFVDAVFPESKIIHISRDPVECILSIRDLWTRKAHGLKSIDKSNYLRRLKEIRPSQIPHYSMEFLRRCIPAGVRGGTTVNLWGPRFPGMQAMVKELGVLPVCCLQWRFCIEACENFMISNPNRVFSLKLEELSEVSLRKIFEHSELSYSNEVFDAFNSRFVPSMAAGRTENASNEDLDTIQRWIGSKYYS
jgi:hypothetical protein